MTTHAKSSLAALALVAGLGLTGAGSAHAGSDVFWSIAMSQPGIHVGVSNAPAPVLVHAPRVYVPPQVVYVTPRPVYHMPPGHYHAHGYGHGHGHWKHHDRHPGHGHHGRGHDRYDRDDRHGPRGGGRGSHDLHMGNRR